ncbi:hypothetical protein OEZ85_000097 [Tetradesmus obliquus]|uniref:CCHC-type domain-containing protein n=1 Tax=Tetradesmus obliquus TaxID=3088 RepID=A0ABY8UP42_TETOB|nr:hypothetical protein OEZ85_000097 [Tetradesmus obliquus]
MGDATTETSPAIPYFSSGRSYAKLTDNNFEEWSMNINADLTSKGLHWESSGVSTRSSSSTADKDRRAYAEIVLTCTQRFQRLIKDCKTGQDAMAKLEAQHKLTCKANLVPLQQALYNLKKLHNESVTAYADRAEGMHDQYLAAGGKMEDAQLALLFQSGLPDTPMFNGVTTAMTVSGKTFSLQEMVNHLLPIELKGNQADNQAFGAFTKSFGGKCHSCGKPGHKARTCQSPGDKPFCTYCRKTGHSKEDCRKRDGASKAPNYSTLALKVGSA